MTNKIMLFIENSILLHGIRVAFLSNNLCNELNLTFKMKICVFTGCVFHDIGKYGINKKILNKPNKLTEQEYEAIKEHTNVNFKFFKNKIIKNIIMYHHENSDGTGYKKLTDIPFEAKIVRVCDMFDALTHDRIYHKKISNAEAVIIMSNEKNNFDVDIFDKFIKLIQNNKRYNWYYNAYNKSLKNVR